MAVLYRGLDLLAADETSDEELEGLRTYNAQTKGYTPASHEFLFRYRPDVFKRNMLAIWAADNDATRAYQARNFISALHYYAVDGYSEGILYETRQARKAGVSKSQMLDVFAITYIHAHASGMNVLAKAIGDYMAEWDPADDDDNAQAFPPEWKQSPDALKSGLDFSSEELLPGERETLFKWYVDNLGEVPGYAQLLADYRPSLLKAHRNRFENAIKGGLPVEMVPYMMLYFSVTRGFAEGIRENVLLARYLGVSRDYTVGAITRGMTSYGGPDAVSIVHKAAGDVLAEM